MSGVPASGKSTWAHEFAQQNGIAYVSRDEIRFHLLKPEDDYFAHETEVLNTFYATITSLLASGKDVIADATHLNYIARKICIDNTFAAKDVILVKIDTELRDCIERNRMREGRQRVPENVIYNMFKKFNQTDHYPYKEIWTIKNGVRV